MAATRGHQRAARLRLNDLATPCFHRFTACGAMPPHLALQFGRRTVPYHSVQRLCAPQQIQQADVRFGSKADIGVECAPASGQVQAAVLIDCWAWWSSYCTGLM